MKNITYTLLAFIALFLISCSGSDTYRGEWKATDKNGTEIDITFSENEFTVRQGEESETYGYSQNKVNISNSVETYGIKLDDGKVLQIHFPIGNDESKGAILDANSMPLYMISRTDYIGYDDVYGL